MSYAKQIKIFVTELDCIARQRGSKIFSTTDLNGIADRMALDIADFDNFLYVLNEQNYLLKKAPRLWEMRCRSPRHK